MKRQFLKLKKITNYASENDYLILEDSGTRINLNMINIEIVKQFNRFIIPTGYIVAVLGTTIYSKEKGLWSINVERVFYPGFPESVTFPKPICMNGGGGSHNGVGIKSDKYNQIGSKILFISGLNLMTILGNDQNKILKYSNLNLAIENLISYLSGC